MSGKGRYSAVSLWSPFLITIILFALSPFVTILTISRDDPFYYSIFSATGMFLYFLIYASWIYSAYKKVDGDLLNRFRVICFVFPFLFSLSGFLSRYINLENLGLIGVFAKTISMVSFLLLVCVLLMLASAIRVAEERRGWPKTDWIFLLAGAAYLPIGVWFLQPKIKAVANVQ